MRHRALSLINEVILNVAALSRCISNTDITHDTSFLLMIQLFGLVLRLTCDIYAELLEHIFIDP